MASDGSFSRGQLKILVIGAGIGGLAAAFCFARQGHKVTLFERQPELTKAGGGVSVRPGASKVLIHWGLESDFSSGSDDYASTILRDLETGRILNRSIATEVSAYPDWGCSRQTVLHILYEHARRAGVEIKLGCPVKRVDDNPRSASLELDDGTVLSADVIFVADGVRSKLRSQVLSDLQSSVEPTITDVSLYTVKVPVAEARQDPDFMELCQDTNLNVAFSKGTFVVFRMHSKNIDEQPYVSGLFGVEGQTDQKSLWDEHGDIEHVRRVFSNANRGLHALLRHGTSCDRWKVTEVPDLPRWTSKHGRILLIGDSAHGMHPNAAQGLSQIIEDIGSLEVLFDERYRDRFPVSTLTGAWENIRKPRVERIKKYAEANTTMFLGKPSASQPRNRKIGPNPEEAEVRSFKDVIPNMSAPFSSASFYKWAYDHDVFAELTLLTLIAAAAAIPLPPVELAPYIFRLLETEETGHPPDGSPRFLEAHSTESIRSTSKSHDKRFVDVGPTIPVCDWVRDELPYSGCEPREQFGGTCNGPSCMDFNETIGAMQCELNPGWCAYLDDTCWKPCEGQVAARDFIDFLQGADKVFWDVVNAEGEIIRDTIDG
ncbi:MAG: hypothetical protein M1820_010320 [Bogoriella megaspora]|nr:MAG: hypothetical protein M1820_010320 [Bogoriella megaspora]